MGAVASCCNRPLKDDKKTIIKDVYYVSPKSNINRFKHLRKNQLNINNIIVTEESAINKLNDIEERNNTEPPTSNYDIEKIKKIQKNFRLFYIHNKFINEIKPSIEKKTTEYLNKLYDQCTSCCLNSEEDVFSEDGWKRYYPANERFFLYSKGEVFPNQIRINNVDNPEKLEIYEGEMNLGNLKHGFGILTTPYYVLKGSWRKGEFTGWGRKYNRNGDILEGKFVKGELNGKGTFKNKESFYVGDFVNGERSGKGDLTTDKYHYKGDFKNNKFEGFGIIEFLNEGQRYEGQFENNYINGKGIYKWKNGDTYEGDMKNGKMDGMGVYTYIDGKKYEGEYTNGIKEGKGKLTYPDGKSFDGNFKNGKPDGEGLYTKDRITYKVLFSQGSFIKVLS